MRILRAADYRRMPWKNGGGETREVLVSPSRATLNAIDWRISLATVASDGPFSAFSGIQRTLCVIHGNGIRLQLGDSPPKLLRKDSAPFTFDGETPTRAFLAGGPIVDLNVMTRLDRFRHKVTRLSIEGSCSLPIHAYTVVFCEHGSLDCSADASFEHLEPEDSLAVNAESSLLEVSATKPARIIVIEITPLPPGSA